jgi:hypothetical protein
MGFSWVDAEPGRALVRRPAWWTKQWLAVTVALLAPVLLAEVVFRLACAGESGGGAPFERTVSTC